MSDEPTQPPASANPDEFPPQLQEALRRMSARGQGPVVDMATGVPVAVDGRMVTDPPAESLVGCVECARAIALGWFGSTARHPGDPNAPVCTLCGEGEATLTAEDWFVMVGGLIARNTASGARRTWRDDAVKGLGAVAMPLVPPPGQE